MLPTASEPWWSPFYKNHHTVVLHVDLSPEPDKQAIASQWLDETERRRSDHFKHAGARRRFELCRASLRAVLCRRLGCDNSYLSFGYSEYDKPFVLLNKQPAPISINVSHSGDHGLIALAPNGRIGVDLEVRSHRRDFDTLIEAAFGKNEQLALNWAKGSERTHLFYKLWTIKEALIKALGTGLSYDPADFEAPASMREAAESALHYFPRLPGLQWRVKDLGTTSFAAALAREETPSDQTLSDEEIYKTLAG